MYLDILVVHFSYLENLISIRKIKVLNHSKKSFRLDENIKVIINLSKSLEFVYIFKVFFILAYWNIVKIFRTM